MKVSFVIFDWDGTLADSKGRIVDTLRGTLTSLGVAAGSDESLAQVIGLALPDCARALVPGSDEAFARAFVQGYRDTWLASDAPPTEAFSGVESTLRSIGDRGIPMAVATGKNRAGLDRELGQTGLGHHFVATRTADETASKPDPLMVHQLLDEVGARAEETIMVGDSHWDLKMAAAAGVRSVAVSYGAQPIGRLREYGPWHCIDAIEHLLDRL
ncbi:MAG: HAD family hydrolase [Nannocystaceae bacterium]|nr:HAD-IA family hydrolase [bacterium]